ncbi:hypothetical protein T08_14707 [Trichinella sp. T8]|nr:hypothetical protein T08_14707 [Trichinella sp. T8]
MFITFIFLANILLLVQPAASYLYGGTSNDEIRLMNECSYLPHIEERLGQDDYFTLLDQCTCTKSRRKMINLHKKPQEDDKSVTIFVINNNARMLHITAMKNVKT